VARADTASSAQYNSVRWRIAFARIAERLGPSRQHVWIVNAYIQYGEMIRPPEETPLTLEVLDLDGKQIDSVRVEPSGNAGRGSDRAAQPILTSGGAQIYSDEALRHSLLELSISARRETEYR
jgi:hypothetical protein